MSLMTSQVLATPKNQPRSTELLRAGAAIGDAEFAELRSRMVLDHCKWDPQVGDVSTLARFPLFIARSTFEQLLDWTRELADEAIVARRELMSRIALVRRLGLTRRALKQLERTTELADSPQAMRFDFHLTTQGWRISECNADVPGGYSEASALPKLMAAHFPDARPPGDPGAEGASAIARSATRTPGSIALLSAAGFMEDHQVVRYLAARLREDDGINCSFAQPEQLRWAMNGIASLDGVGDLSTIVRFYQAEWLATLPRRANWRRLYSPRAGGTTVVNDCTSSLIESKRFPLIWNHLESTRMKCWRTLLPETREVRAVRWKRDDSWLLKSTFCNTGDSVSIRSQMPRGEWRRAAWSAFFNPSGWIAQRRFEPIGIDSPIGTIYPCIGMYWIDGHACGAYTRISTKQVIDYSAIDAALLIEPEP